MNKIMKVVTSVGSATLLLSNAAMATPPAFGLWKVTDGAITDDSGSLDVNDIACPSGFTCSSPLTGAGFFQRQVMDASGNRYFQTIITEVDALGAQATLEDDLTFYDESFVKALFNSGNATGIMDKQHIQQVDINPAFANDAVYVKFVADTNINSGDWAGDYMTLYQLLEDTHKEGFRTDFFFAAADLAATTANSPDNMWMKITAEVGLTGKLEGNNLNNPDAEIQYFVMSEARGQYNDITAPYDIVLDGAINNDLLPQSVLTVNAGNDVTGTWVSQDMTKTVGQNFSFEAYENKTTGTPEGRISKFGLDLTAVSSAEAWNAATPILTGMLGDIATDGTGWSSAQRFPSDPIVP